MAVVMVSASTGVMNSLMRKLTTLMGEEYRRLKNVHKEVASLRDELSSMNAFLERLADTDELDVQTKEWRNHVREMTYDIEDCTDDFVHRLDIDGADDKDGFVHEIARRLKDLRARHKIAKQIRDLKARVQEVSERRTRYRLDECISESSFVAVDPRLSALHVEAPDLVGIEGPKEFLTRLLMEGEAISSDELKVVSIVGSGGIGKTTLANQVYRMLEVQFDCKGFVSMSQKPDLTRILTNLLSKVGREQPTRSQDLQDLINSLRGHLQDKRYLFVVDDIWDESVWDIIKCAFPKSNKRSRIITTTRIESVAAASCIYSHGNIYRLQPLANQDSKKLFSNRVFGPENDCPQQFEEAVNEILQKCGGLPLAILSIASLLATQPTRSLEKWEYVKNSLRFSLGTNPIVKGMREILNLSYRNLPNHLKTCMLYLSAYPEDDYIHRNDLVRQWVAEGFVSAIHQRDVEEVAGSYFNELINRSMIQPLYTDNNGDVLECRVHDMILDLIVLKSAEENFFTVVAGDDDLRSAVSGARHEVRRLCHRPTAGAAIATAATTASAAHIRSFVFSGQCSLMVPLSRFKFLRVLNLHVVQSSGAGGGDVDLTSICRLFHLRYLKVTTSENARAQLPAQIRGLQHLETLEVHGDLAGGAIPSDVVHLPRLSHLIVPGSTRLPEGIGSMRSLRTLEVLRVDLTSMDGLKSLGELASLRSLGVWCFGEDRAQQPELWDTFWSSIASLASHGLRGLTLFGPLLPPAAMDMAGRPLLPVAEYRLQTLDAQLWLFHGVPQWIGQLRRLHRLDLTVNSLRKDGVDALAALPALLYLCLRAVCPPRRWLVVGAGGFPALVDFFFTCSAPRLAFKEGAMPKVKCIHLTFHAHSAELFGPVLEHLAGLRELPSLELLSATIGTGEADIEETMAAEGALWRAFMNHPRNARVHTQRADGLTSDFFDVADGDDHDGSGVDLELIVQEDRARQMQRFVQALMSVPRRSR